MRIFCRSEGTEQSMVRKALAHCVAAGAWACRPFWATDFPARRVAQQAWSSRGTDGCAEQPHSHRCHPVRCPLNAWRPSSSISSCKMLLVAWEEEASETNLAILLQTCNRERSAFISQYRICALQAMFQEKSVKLALAAISESSTWNRLSPGSPRAWLRARSVYVTLMFLPAFN